jgi:hypothetical protein
MYMVFRAACRLVDVLRMGPEHTGGRARVACETDTSQGALLLLLLLPRRWDKPSAIGFLLLK